MILIRTPIALIIAIYNANGVRDCRELLEIRQQRKISQTERFRSKNALIFGSIYVCESTFSTMEYIESKNRSRMAAETLDDSLRLAPLTLVLIKER